MRNVAKLRRVTAKPTNRHVGTANSVHLQTDQSFGFLFEEVFCVFDLQLVYQRASSEGSEQTAQM